MHDDLYIDTPQRLAALCRRLEGRPWLALDTEFLRDKSYRPRLCLLQVAAEDVVACVDPLALENLTPLLDLLYDPSIVKVLHSAYQDLEIFYYLRGAPPRPVFDTQIAALLAGHGDQIGYAALVQALLGVTLDKAHTRTDWSRRPLQPAQLQYAADDVRYLGPLYLRLRDELEHRGRLAWLQEDFTALTDPATYANPPGTAWRRIRGAERLTDAQFAVLAALAAWREQTAQRSDRPRQWILSDDGLLELARHRPASLEKLAGIRGLKPGALDNYGAGLLELIRSDRHAPAAARPERRPPPSSAVEPLVDVLMAVVRLRGAQTGISPATLASRKELEQLAAGDETVGVLHGWRKGVAGADLQAVLSGAAGLRVEDGALHIEYLKPAE